MLKLRTILLIVMVGGVFASLPTVASAQLPQSVVDQLVPKYRGQGPCRDPWITIAINDVFANTRTIQGQGDMGECEPARYNNGSWSNYAELYQGVKTAFNNLSAAAVTTTLTRLPDGTGKITVDGGGGYKDVQSVRLIGHDGASLIGHDGASVIASGGGNFNGQATADGNEKRIKLGKSVLIIKKKQ